MLRIDMRNAFDRGSGADNFTVVLLRLIAKADGENREKLARGFPAEVAAVGIFQYDCPYLDENRTEVDWERIEVLARQAKKE